jgi:monofunctional biosynthetic peptidoglycan transglycosylase
MTRCKTLWHQLLKFLGYGCLALVLLSILLTLALRWLPPPGSAFMLQHRVATWWYGRQGPPYRWVDWQAISPYAALAVIAAEDQKFPHHHGFDVSAMAEAWQAWQDTGRLRGASTISQQVAKNLYLWPGRSVVRKGLEAYCTVLIELLWPKRRILEVYLNVVEFGTGVYGIGAASQTFFGKPPAHLQAQEAALLAAVLPAPSRWHVERPSAHVLRRRAWILRQMEQLGGLSYLQNL